MPGGSETVVVVTGTVVVVVERCFVDPEEV
jgi:hypothetical protein